MGFKNNFKPEMSKLSFKIRFYILIFIAFASLLITASIVGAGRDTLKSKKSSIARPDLINIDTMNTFGELQEPTVKFYHDLHSDALDKDNKDCLKCHKSIENKLVPKFMRVDDGDRQEVMDIYHNNCIGCHEDTMGKTGPVVCRDCHTKKETAKSSREPMGFDNSLHFRHTDALDSKCELCHHDYDATTQKLFYAKGKEGSCRYCHKTQKEDNRISFREAAHESCLACHMKLAEKKKETGPVKCGGCHDLTHQKNIKKIKPAPAIKRNQSDFVMIKTGDTDSGTPLKYRMDYVPFNHKRHEQSNDNCRVCHHKAIGSCNLCHSLEGKKEGGNINLERAIHTPDATQSCIGCHNIKKEAEACLGCHTFIPENNGKSDASCTVCHIKPSEALSENAMDNLMAKELLDRRSLTAPVFSKEEIPETIIIDRLSKRYKATEFPHGKIIRTLVNGVNDSRLAMVFHNEQGLVCQGCHHNLPVTRKPSGCSTCHEAGPHKKLNAKPDLKAAYHIQCMECHDMMKVGKTGCTDCHDKK